MVCDSLILYFAIAECNTRSNEITTHISCLLSLDRRWLLLTWEWFAERGSTRESENMEFEEAIKYRDLYNSVKQVSQKQKITDSDGEDKDIIALALDENDAVVQVFLSGAEN